MPVNFVDAPNNFYLGVRVNPETHERIDDQPITYDARDLTTHGVILGMTGSGKTGLGITILEEAALDGIPQIVIDPKGDMTNMLLAFPEMTGDHFRPWVNPDDAPKSAELQDYAQTVATRWQEGLTDWGITEQRVQAYRRSSRFSIYTPGSEAGLPVSVLASFARPPEGWEGHEEELRERISGLVTAILGLIGISAQPLEDPEHILLSNIFEYNWRNNSDLTMETLILHVQDPPFTKLGVLDVDTVLPRSSRLDLAKKLNNIISAPSFQSWTEGQPLDIPSLLFTPEGSPRTSIFYIAHLTEAEQHFIVTILMENILTWMNSLSGSSSLRALVYIDEVFGMFPPAPYNPTTKGPLMRLLKQARAFGIGMLLSTQNAKDLDYKGLSNAGTWWIGKLQTENDRQRVLEGLNSAASADSSFNTKRLDSLIGELGSREFVMHNVHAEDTPLLMRSRWAMSYLRGPLVKPQISSLMENQRGQVATPAPAQRPPSMLGTYTPETGRAGGLVRARANAPTAARQSAAAAQSTGGASTPGAEETSRAPTYSGDRPAQASTGARPLTQQAAPPGFSPAQPSLPSSVEQYFLPTEYTLEQAMMNRQRVSGVPPANTGGGHLLYAPSLLAQMTVRFTHRQTNSQEVLWYAYIVPDLPRMAHVEWADYQSEPFDPTTLDLQPYAEAYYADIPPALNSGSSFTELRKSLVDWLYNNLAVTVLHNTALDVYNGFNESRSDFVARVQQLARQERDQAVDKIAEKYSRQFDRLEEKIEDKSNRIRAEEKEQEMRETETMLTAGETALRLLRGQLYRTISRVAQLRRYSEQTEDRVGVMEADLQQLVEDLDELEANMDRELQEAQRKWAAAVKQVEEVPIHPNKRDITPALFGIGWVPYWKATINGSTMVLPASSSQLTAQQQTVQGLIAGGGAGGGAGR